MSSLDNRQATLKNLSYALRHRETWPAGFEWNYQDCYKCAMGLAHRMWPQQVAAPSSDVMAETFGMNPFDASMVFLHAGAPATPEQIADKIDELSDV